LNHVLRLGPGDAYPAWIEALERPVFGEVWEPQPLASHEVLFVLEPFAYARWSVVPAAGEAELLRIAVAMESRKRGHARNLMAFAEMALVQEGITTLHLEVRVSNQAARSLYESMGWICQHVRKAYYRDGEDAVLYRKDLGA
jgi:ribosomal-protein-alanine N-acetyltransferase